MTNNISERILYCDSSCVIVNKIAGEAAEGAGPGMIDLPRLLSEAEPELNLYWPPALPAGDVLAVPAAAHRLDVPVSGCIVFARTGTGLRRLNDIFSSGAAERRYWAVVEHPREGAAFTGGGEITELVHWLEFDSRKNKSIAHDEYGPGRKKAVMRYRLAGEGRDYLFMEIELVTGRRHQIRAQFAKVGLHVKGDLKYGARRSEKNGGIRLHARSLSFSIPWADDETGRVPDGKLTALALPPLRDNLWLALEEALGKAEQNHY